MKFDMEGVPTQRNVVINDGVLKTYLHNTSTAKRYKTKTVSPGNILRKEIKKKTKLGKKIKEMMRNGDLVPDHIIKSIIDKEIKKSKSPVVLDGSPRDLAQAKVLKDVSMVLFLRCTKKEAVKRLLKRAKTENRPDDTKEVI